MMMRKPIEYKTLNQEHNVEYLVSHLGLSPHPEGGYFRESYRSLIELDNINGFSGLRSCSTGIYFLLTRQSKSHFHRIKSDEMWHFYSGSPVRLVMLSEDSGFSEIVLGPDLRQGQVFQFTVPAGVWFAAEVYKAGAFSLTGCTVAPGFDFADFEMAQSDQLRRDFPDHQKIIDEFCLKESKD